MRKTLDELGLRLEARGRIILAALAGAVFVGAVLGAYGLNDDREAQPVVVAQGRGHVEGFTSIAFKVTNKSGEARDGCALLADSDRTRAKGLQDLDDLAGYDGMIFRFAEDATSAFYMADVRFPLSIAWFDADGRFVSAADMPRCEVSATQCPTYGASRPYRYAMEVGQGDLDDVGAIDGSTLQLGNLCS